MPARHARVVAIALLVSACAGGGRTAPTAPTGPVATYVVQAKFTLASGSVVVAPRIVFAAGCAAEISVMDETTYVRDVDVGVAADGTLAPVAVPGVVAKGVRVSVFAESVPGRDDQVALAFDVQSARSAEGSPVRSLAIAPPPSPPVIVALPRTETSAFAGALRLTLGATTSVATFPSDAGDVTVSLSAQRVSDAGGEAPGDAGASLLAALAHAAAVGSARVGTFTFEEEGDLLAGPMTGPAGGPRGAPPSAAASRTRSVTTVLAPGAHAERRLDVAFVAGAETRGASLDPTIATFTSGCDITVGDDGKFHVRWTAAPRFVARRVAAGTGDGLDVDQPQSARAAAATPIRPGETEFPMGSFTSGASAVVRLTCELP